MAPATALDISNNSSNYHDIDTATSLYISSSYQLPSNSIYIQHFPNFLIVLSIIYTLCFLTRYSIRKFRRFRDKKQQQEKRRLRQAWTTSMIKHQLLLLERKSLLPCSQKENEKGKEEEEEETKTIAYPPSIYIGSTLYNYSTSSLTINNDPPSLPSTTCCGSPLNSEKSTFLFALNNSSKTCCSTANSSSTTIEVTPSHSPTINNNHFPLNKIIDTSNKTVMMKPSSKKEKQRQKSKLSKYPSLASTWKISKAKRLSLLWQWSVSMGYTEYNHAKVLNDLVLQLCRPKQEYGFDNNDEESGVMLEVDKEKITSSGDTTSSCCVVAAAATIEEEGEHQQPYFETIVV